MVPKFHNTIYITFLANSICICVCIHSIVWGIICLQLKCNVPTLFLPLPLLAFQNYVRFNYIISLATWNNFSSTRSAKPWALHEREFLISVENRLHHRRDPILLPIVIVKIASICLCNNHLFYQAHGCSVCNMYTCTYQHNYACLLHPD